MDFTEIPPHKHPFWKSNERDFYNLHLKYGWSIEDFGKHMLHLRVTIPCDRGVVKFDFWPSSGKLKRTGYSEIAVKVSNVETAILLTLKNMAHKPI